jgi:NAD(P)-dependent dehydrogenase (short-subunit alcohol dehydrogenase family)
MDVCVIGGVGPGNGAAFTKRFLSGGYKVAMIARAQDRLRELERELPGAVGFQADLTKQDSVRDVFQRIKAQFGPVRVLVQNAAGFARGGFLETKPDDFESAWRAGPWALLLAGQAVAPDMVADKKGSIVVVGATASVRGGALFSAFAASKAGQRSLAQSMARDLGPKGVHVAHVLVDGQIDSPRMTQLAGPAQPGQRLRSEAIAEEVFHLTTQEPSAWTFELDLRPSVEKW